VGFYNSVFPVAPARPPADETAAEVAAAETGPEVTEVAEPDVASMPAEEAAAAEAHTEPALESVGEPPVAEEVTSEEAPEPSAEAAAAERVMSVTAEADPAEAPQAAEEAEAECHAGEAATDEAFGFGFFGGLRRLGGVGLGRDAHD